MKAFSKSLAIVMIIALTATVGIAAGGDQLEGRWEASFDLNGTVVPFRLDLSGQGANFKGTLYNGDQQQTTTSARIENGTVALNFDHYLTKIVFDGSRPLVLEVTPTKEGTLEILPSGAYTNKGRLTAYRPKDARAKGLPEPSNFTSHTRVKDPQRTI